MSPFFIQYRVHYCESTSVEMVQLSQDKFTQKKRQRKY